MSVLPIFNCRILSTSKTHFYELKKLFGIRLVFYILAVYDFKTRPWGPHFFMILHKNPGIGLEHTETKTFRKPYKTGETEKRISFYQDSLIKCVSINILF